MVGEWGGAVKYLSVCSGIEAATAAWHSLGWGAAWYSEVEAFPSAVLAHHYPDTPNLGDMTKFKEWPDAAVDLLVGGTPCQSFSVAGLRKGLDDPRGNLMLTYLAIAAKYRPRWLVWENVPGVLSSNGGRDFAALLRGLDELGYGWAFRVLDAQYFGVAQRRRRVFVVGHLGDWHRAAAVLFERASLSGHPAPSREAGQKPALCIAGCANGGGANGPGRDADSAESLVCIGSGQANAEVRTDGGAPALTCLHEAPIIAHAPRGEGFDASEDGTGRRTPLVPVTVEVADTLGVGANQTTGFATEVCAVPVVQPVNIYGGNKRADRPEGGFYVRMDEDTSKTLDAASGLNPTCSQGGTAVLQAVAFTHQAGGDQTTLGYDPEAGTAPTLAKSQTPAVIAPTLTSANNPSRSPQSSEVTNQVMSVMQATAYIGGVDYENNAHTMEEPTGPLLKGSPTGGGHPLPAIVTAMQVRRLTPVECERLQGFPDNYTNIPWRKQPTSPDGPRYKALGNSMAVPVMRWIGERIQAVDLLPRNRKSNGGMA